MKKAEIKEIVIQKDSFVSQLNEPGFFSIIINGEPVAECVSYTEVADAIKDLMENPEIIKL